MDDLRVGGEEPERPCAEEEEQDSNGGCVEVAEPQKVFKSLLYTVKLSCPHVLSDVGGRGQGQAVGGEGQSCPLSRKCCCRAMAREPKPFK